jgi:polar amino acid transport system substrate-binding protein
VITREANRISFEPSRFMIYSPRGLLRLWSCLCIAGALLIVGASAQDRSDSSPLRVGVSPVFPPMVFKQGKQLVGVEVDLALAFGASLGRKVDFVEIPWEGQIEALSAGEIDIIMSSMSITMARRHVVDFSRPYLTVGQMALVRADSQQKYLLGFPLKPPGTVGVLKATTGEFLAQREFPKTPRKSFKSESDALQALKKKKIDLFISDSTLIWHLAGKHSTEGVVAVPIALSEEQLAWGVSKGNEQLLSAANEFIQKSTQDGSLKQAFRRWTAIPP